MNPPTPDNSMTDLPTKVFEQFVQEAGGTDLPPEIIERLRVALIEDKSFGEQNLRSAIFGEEPSP
jgi:hypothetical protein